MVQYGENKQNWFWLIPETWRNFIQPFGSEHIFVSEIEMQVETPWLYY